MPEEKRFSLNYMWGPAVSLVLFSLATWLLHRELAAYHLEDILHQLASIPSQRVAEAVLLTAACYGVMTGYDALALRYIRHPIAYRKSALASFVGYTFSNNIGLSMLAGASVRYRLYSAWGLSMIEISQVVFFCVASLWLGFCLLFGVMALSAPTAMPAAFHLPFRSTQGLGLIGLSVVAAYILAAGLRKKPLVIRGENVLWPRLGLVPWQLAIGTFDWALAAGVLYLLSYPDGTGISFANFLGAFLVAQLAGLVSQVPGGLGVFESVFTVLLAPVIPAPQILGGLLAYRVVYYWLPLAIAIVLLGGQELLRGRRVFRGFEASFGRWISPLIPQVFGLCAFLTGTILLLSGATPAVDSRLAVLKQLMPLPLIEMSHFTASVVGMALLLLGRGLQRRLDAAYWLALVLLALGMAASIIKGLDYEEALALLTVAAALAPCRRHFYRRASLLDGRFSASWVAAVLIVLGGSIWLGIYSYRHVEYADRLWWQFTFVGHASRFLRASLGAVLLLLFFAAARLMRPAAPRSQAPQPEEMERVWSIVQETPDTSAHLAMLGDKTFLFNAAGTAFLMYGISGNSWIAMNDPVGPEGELEDLVWRFREAADRHGDRAVFYQVSRKRLPLYLDMGLSLLKIGEEARVALSGFNLEGRERKGFRHTLHKLEREGCRFEMLPPGAVTDGAMPYKEISDQWLASKSGSEKGFSMGFFSETYLDRYPMAVVRQHGRMMAFANVWQGAGREELSLDLMRYRPEAPHGIMEYLFLQIMLWGKADGYRWFNLGMAPLSGFETRSLAPVWSRLGGFVYRYGEHFYNFKGIRNYKEKFTPVWHPKYLACPGGISLPRTLADVSLLISGGVKGLLIR
jgi:phosphatidylglycerol lysyltransferase